MTTYYVSVDSPESGESFIGHYDSRESAEAQAMAEYSRLGYPVAVIASSGETVMECA